MEARYRADFTTMNGVSYRIDIMDNLYPPGAPAAEMNIGMHAEDGFTLAYEGDNQDITTHILASKCTVHFMIENSTQESFIDELINAQENRFFIRIYRKNIDDTVNPIWTGNVLNDLLQYDDAGFPYEFKITAADGLALLKNIDYPVAGEKRETIIQYLTNSFSHLPIATFFSAGEIMFKTYVNWYATRMFGTTFNPALDPLNVSAILNNPFFDTNSDGKITVKNYYEILQQITEFFNLRIFQADGVFYIIQINELANDALPVRTYDITGAQLSSSQNLNISTTIQNRRGDYSFFRPLGKVSVKYNYKQIEEQITRIPDQQYYSPKINMGITAGGSGETIVFSGTVNFQASDDDNVSADNYCRFRLQLQVGDYYLAKNLGEYVWTTTPSYIDFLSDYHANFNYTGSFNISFETEKIPAIGTGYFYFDFVDFVDGAGNEVTPPSDLIFDYYASNFNLKQTGGKGTANYIAENSQPGSLSEKKLPDLLIGDGASVQSDGRIIVKDTAGNWIAATKEWTVGGSGMQKFINQLLCDQVLSLQQTARRLYQGTIRTDNFWPFNTFLIENRKYTLLSGEFNANTGDWNGTFHEIKQT